MKGRYLRRSSRPLICGEFRVCRQLLPFAPCEDGWVAVSTNSV
jgi:hypothetical protein